MHSYIVYKYIHTYRFVHVLYIHSHTWIHIKSLMHVCLHPYHPAFMAKYVHTYLPTYIFIYMYNICIHALIHMYRFMFACLHTYTHAQTHTHTHTHTYIYIYIYIYTHATYLPTYIQTYDFSICGFPDFHILGISIFQEIGKFIVVSHNYFVTDEQKANRLSSLVPVAKTSVVMCTCI